MGARKRLPVGRVYVLGAAKYGHLVVLQWARANGCPWDEYTCSWAAGADELEALRWAHENGCPWDENTCAQAANGGHLDVLKWAHRNGCPWDEWTRLNALRSRMITCFSGRAITDALTTVMKTVKGCGDLERGI